MVTNAAWWCNPDILRPLGSIILGLGIAIALAIQALTTRELRKIKERENEQIRRRLQFMKGKGYKNDN